MLEKNFALTLSSFYYNFKKLLQLQTALTKIVYFKVFWSLVSVTWLSVGSYWVSILFT